MVGVQVKVFHKFPAHTHTTLTNSANISDTNTDIDTNILQAVFNRIPSRRGDAHMLPWIFVSICICICHWISICICTMHIFVYCVCRLSKYRFLSQVSFPHRCCSHAAPCYGESLATSPNIRILWRAEKKTGNLVLFTAYQYEYCWVKEAMSCCML